MTTGIPVFVGSTFVDLQSYRDAVRQALHRLEAVVRGMEYFGSLPGMPKDDACELFGVAKFMLESLQCGTVQLMKPLVNH